MRVMAKQNTATLDRKSILDLTASALAKAVADGDLVNFTAIFMPASPAHEDSTENFNTDKYAYMLPDSEQEQQSQYKDALDLVRKPEIWTLIQQELDANRPAQLPYELVMLLADNALRLEKFTCASQAYEILRIRERMQQEFLAHGDKALDNRDMATAVRAYRTAIGLAYDYAAFPSPLPEVADYQARALVLHGDYPEKIEDCVGMKDTESFVQVALNFLLVDASIAARLAERSIELKLDFLKELVLHLDPNWDAFSQRFREAQETANELHEKIKSYLAESSTVALSLAEEIEGMLVGDPRRIAHQLLGREIQDGEWWQYLKELTYKHPAAALFVARQELGKSEVIVPRCRPDLELAVMLGLTENK